MKTMTSIQVSKKSKERWAKIKNHPQESYEDMINRIIQTAYEDGEQLTKKDLKDIAESLKDFENNRFTTNHDLKKELGLCSSSDCTTKDHRNQPGLQQAKLPYCLTM